MAPESAEAIETPCIGICRIEGRYCAGCKRTIREIGAWSAMNPAERRAILGELADRHAATEKP